MFSVVLKCANFPASFDAVAAVAVVAAVVTANYNTYKRDTRSNRNIGVIKDV